jgi:uncharacterized MAPEG superfamily protein
MTMELMYLTWVSLFTAVMWVLYALNQIGVRGLIDTIGYPENPFPLSPWAERMKKAHSNAVENLVVFAALVLVVHLSATSNEMTAMACMVYFWARVAHFVVYTFGIPLVRTLSFVVGFSCQLVLGLTALGMM